MKKVGPFEHRAAGMRINPRVAYTKEEFRIDTELSEFVEKSIDHGMLGFVVSADVKKMVFFGDYYKTMKALSDQQKLSLLDDYQY